MKFKLLGVILMAVFVIAGTSCKSGKACKGGGWYGNRNLGYEATSSHKPITNTKKMECTLREETCASTNP